MTVTVGTDTYVTVSEADLYFVNKYGYDKWVSLDELTKEKVLVSATQHLDVLCSWYGSPVSGNQNLAFPRTPDADPVPQEIKNAQCEIAYNIIDNGSTSTISGPQLKKLEAKGNLEWFQGSNVFGNPLINDLTVKTLAPYGLCAGTGNTQLIPMVLG